MDDLVSRTAAGDFTRAKDFFQGLAPERTAKIVASAADVTLVIDAQGIIRDAAFGVEALFNSGGRSWAGRPLTETVTIECEDKVELLLSEARAGGAMRSREINHSLPHGEDMPVRYSAAQLGDDGSVIVFGQDISRIAVLQQKLMNAQLSMERDFAKLRAGELRYRMMFQLSDVAQLVVEAEGLTVADINAAAARVLGEDTAAAKDKTLAKLFDTDDSALLENVLRATVDEDREHDIAIHLRDGNALTLTATPFRQERRTYLLIHLMARGDTSSSGHFALDRQVMDIVEQMPDAFVLTTPDRKVLATNAAFLDLLNIDSVRDTEGTIFDHWFERPGVDCNVLIANVEEHGIVRRFATMLRSRFGRVESVELAATRIPHRDTYVLGFIIRPLAAPAGTSMGEETALTRSNEQITNLVGHMPLKDIVRETTHMIEQLCIETALDLTKGNRVSAARMLGLSRQSLYAKLARDSENE
ncbi:transcriptional regulator PpsR [Ahrensia sp. R2A130]|uniref:transcriptional regulator PpsR n=1 Tax=Ahrensia sp. R2A130 TaxID=744979 RepID=UPI0001E08C74|nr:transcriptional regulator PpsR [Ahrensia sp. R2A130]EFL89097.1 transcriptional regulator PpsR [Ahrensia sp. R2A130]